MDVNIQLLANKTSDLVTKSELLAHYIDSTYFEILGVQSELGDLVQGSETGEFAVHAVATALADLEHIKISLERVAKYSNEYLEKIRK